MPETCHDASAGGQGFVVHLRQALNHLYDSDILIRSPLCEALGITGSYDRAIKLQRLLEEAVTALKPGPAEPPRSHGWRIYHLLTYRYLQRFSQKEVADQLGVSLSQLAREQRRALSVLASYLWEEYHVARQQVQSAAENPSTGSDEPVGSVDDTAWLALSAPGDAPDLAQTLTEVGRLVGSLSASHRVNLKVDAGEHLPRPAINHVALRQILLSVLNSAILFGTGGRVRVSAVAANGEVVIHIKTSRPDATGGSLPSDIEASLAMAQQMVRVSGGQLFTEVDNSTLMTRVVLPVVQSVLVLVVEDSADSIRLLERFLSHTRYRLLAASSLEQVVDQAERVGAQVVLLDIMMPLIDGWTVLHALRSHPATARLPVVICSILPLEELALSLGADAFLHKPVSQAALLATLDRVVPLP